MKRWPLSDPLRTHPWDKLDVSRTSGGLSTRTGHRVTLERWPVGRKGMPVYGTSVLGSRLLQAAERSNSKIAVQS